MSLFPYVSLIQVIQKMVLNLMNYQGAKKVSFTACPWGKLWLACISLKVILTSVEKKLIINIFITRLFN